MAAAAAALAAAWPWRLARADCPAAECHDEEVSVALPIIGLLLGCALSLGFCHLAIRLWMRRRESAFLRAAAPPVALLRPQPPRLCDSDPVLSGAMPGAPPSPPRYCDA
ncbi:uncharacterized protein [Dermacentor albipictus]|uniref:uncharacterized protein isoform X2 n=1 Tax=Dermacentor albipictus TaxID=60249 RepID=UPI0031FD5817